MLRAAFADLALLAVGLAATIPPATASAAQQTACDLLDRFLRDIPPGWRGLK